MTKTLTEQWREGTIEYGLYYVRIVGRNDITIADTNLDEELNVEEVLCPVPSYDEYNDLIQQSVNQAISIKTYIERIKELEEMFDGEAHANLELIKKEKQLQEANEVIKHYAEKNGYHKAMDYLNKYGVK